MRVLENGIYRDMTPEEVAEIEANAVTSTYKENVVAAIREKYSIDDEIAILRQRDSKPEEFNAYYEDVEAIKRRIKGV
jgi:hypothetical protein